MDVSSFFGAIVAIICVGAVLFIISMIIFVWFIITFAKIGRNIQHISNQLDALRVNSSNELNLLKNFNADNSSKIQSDSSDIETRE